MDEQIDTVLAEDLGEGYRIVRDTGELSPTIDWVDWVTDPDTDAVLEVRVNFADGSAEIFPAGTSLRQIWHEDAN